MEASVDKFENKIEEAIRVLLLTKDTLDKKLMRFQISEAKRLLSEAETAFALITGGCNDE